MALRELLIVTVLVFSLAVYMVVAGPTIDGVSGGMNTSKLAGDHSVGFDSGAKIGLVKEVTLVLVPTLLGIGLILYAYASIAKKESYRGRL